MSITPAQIFKTLRLEHGFEQSDVSRCIGVHPAKIQRFELGGVSARDARTLAGQMSAEAELIQRQPKGTFATFIRGVTDRAVPISFPFFVLENMEQTTKEERDAIVQHSRNNYAEPLYSKANHSDTKDDSGDSEPSEIDEDDPWSPSSEL